MSKYYQLKVVSAEITTQHSKHKFPSLKKQPKVFNVYTRISIDDVIQRSEIVENTTKPTWNETFPILSLLGDNQRIVIDVNNHTSMASSAIGSIKIPVNELLKQCKNGEAKLNLHSQEKSETTVSAVVLFEEIDASGIVWLVLTKLLKTSPTDAKAFDEVSKLIQSGETVCSSGLPKSVEDAIPAIKAFIRIGERFAEAHPLLKLLWAVASGSFEVVNGQRDFDKKVQGLIADLKRIFYILRDAEGIRQPLDSFKDTINELLDLAIQCSIVIREYTRHSFGGRLIHTTRKEEIEDASAQLKKLREELASSFTRQILSIADRRANDALLEKLRKLLNPDTSYMFGRDRPQCLEGTRENVRKKIKQWALETESPNVLLLLGAAGTGKSTILTSIASMFQEDRKLGCHLFFLKEKSDPNMVIASIAYDLAQYSGELADRIESAFKGRGDIGRATTKSQFKFLLQEPLQGASTSGPVDPVLIVLDALDECGSPEKRKSIVEVLKDDLSTLPPYVRILISSRPVSDILPFTSLPNTWTINLDETAEDSKEDVLTYLRHELGNLRDEKKLVVPQDWPWDEKIHALAEKADGLFIWASTAVKFMTGKGLVTSKRLENLITDGQSVNLDNLYATILSSFDWDWEEEESKTLFSGVLSLVFFGKSQLSDVEIDNILKLEEVKSEYLLSRLQSLVKYEPGQPIRIHHASFFDYLVSCEGAQWKLDPSMAKVSIVERCFDTMDRYLRPNICNLDSSFKLNRDVSDLKKRVREKIPTFLRYTCSHWVNHLQDVPYSQDLGKKLRVFVEERMLFWFEVLSLTETYNENVGRILMYANAWLKDKDMESSAILLDALRQASTFSEPISESTPHLYTTLLPFTKNDSLFSKNYAKYANQAVQVTYTGKKLRTACIKDIVVNKTSSVTSVNFSHDGTQIVSGSDEPVVYIWDTASGKRIFDLSGGHSDFVFSVKFFPDQKHIASGGRDGTICIWSDIGELVYGPLKVDASGSVLSVNISPDGKYIATGLGNGAIGIWSVESGNLEGKQLKIHTSQVNSVSFSHDGQYLVSGSNDNTVIIWNTKKGVIYQSPMKGHTDWVRSVTFSPDSKIIVSGSDDGSVRVWDSSSVKEICVLPESGDGYVYSVAYSSDGKYILAGSEDGTIRMWNADDMSAPPRQFSGHSWPVSSVSFAPDNKRFASGSFDGMIKIWDVTCGTLRAESTCRQGEICQVVISRSGKYVASSSTDRTICVWDVDSGELAYGPYSGRNEVSDIALSPNDEFLVFGSNEEIAVWNLDSGEFATIQTNKIVNSLTLSPTGKHIAFVSEHPDFSISIWDLDTGKSVIGPIEGHEKYIPTLAYSPDGTRIVSGSCDETIRIWNAVNGKQISVLRGHLHWVSSVAFSHNGTLIVSGSIDEKILVWNAETGKIVCGPIKGHTGYVMSVCFSPDDRWIISGSKDKTARIWDSLKGCLLFGPFIGHTDFVESVSFFPDGRRFASGSYDRTIRIWTVDDVPWKQGGSSSWVVGKEGELLIWMPPESSTSLMSPDTLAILNRSFITKLDFTYNSLGNDWLRCFPSL